MWDFLVCVQVFVHIHGEIHHVRVAEEVQLPLKKLLFIVDLSQMEAKHILFYSWRTVCKNKQTNELSPVVNGTRPLQSSVANVDHLCSL